MIDSRSFTVFIHRPWYDMEPLSYDDVSDDNLQAFFAADEMHAKRLLTTPGHHTLADVERTVHAYLEAEAILDYSYIIYPEPLEEAFEVSVPAGLGACMLLRSSSV